MKKATLGKTGIEVAPLVFGGNVFGWTVDEPTAFDLLDSFAAAGFNFIDTADSYSTWAPGNVGGESETIIGNWLKKRGRREDVIIGTKVGSDMGHGNKGVSKPYILKAVEDSLRRLQTDYIDLYQNHFDDPATPVEETLEAFDALVKAGKVRAIGASNMTQERLEESLNASASQGLQAYQTLQPHYNLYDRAGFELGYEAICQQHQLGVIPYYSLASGFLTGKYRTPDDFDKSPRGGGMAKYLNDRGLHILDALDEVAARHNTSVAAVSLAWLIAQPAVTAPIASATSLSQLTELTKAANLDLTAADVQMLNDASVYS